MSKIKPPIIIPGAQIGEPVQASPFRNSLVECRLSLSQEELDAIARLQIHLQEDKTFSFFGDLNDLDPAKIESFLTEVSAGDQTNSGFVSQVVLSLACKAAELVGGDAAWVDLRAGSLPKPYFDIPRWHRDAEFFTPSPKEGHYKFAATLKGSITKFARINNLERYQILQKQYGDIVSQLMGLDQNGEADSIRLEIDKVVDEVATEGAGFFFLVANKKKACVHSEPVIDGSRLFMSVLPGTLDQVESLRERWQKEKVSIS